MGGWISQRSSIPWTCGGMRSTRATPCPLFLSSAHASDSRADHLFHCVPLPAFGAGDLLEFLIREFTFHFWQGRSRSSGGRAPARPGPPIHPASRRDSERGGAGLFVTAFHFGGG